MNIWLVRSSGPQPPDRRLVPVVWRLTTVFKLADRVAELSMTGNARCPTLEEKLQNDESVYNFMACILRSNNSMRLSFQEKSHSHGYTERKEYRS